MYQQKIDTAGLTYAPAARARREDRIVEDYLPLVRKIAWHVHGSQSSLIEIEDLVQIGLIALVKAARNYEDKGASFASYATTRVRGAMIDQLRKVATISRRGMANRRALEAARRALEGRLGRAATDGELANEMGLDAETFFEMQASGRALDFASLEDAYSEANLLFADFADNADDEIENRQLLGEMADGIAQLGEREALILQLYFVEERNLTEIAEVLGVGSARVCQIKKRALEKVRAHLEAAEDD